jgi:hypothetical protein
MPRRRRSELLLLQPLQLLQGHAALLKLVCFLFTSLLPRVSFYSTRQASGSLTFWTSLCSAAASSTAGT